MAIKDCVAAIKLSGGEEVTEDEALDIMGALERQINERRRRDPSLSPDKAVREASEALAEEEKIAALIEKRSRMINVLRKKERFSKYTDGREASSISAINVGAEGPAVGIARSVDAERQGIFASLVGPLVGELRKAGLLTIFRSRDATFDRDVARELWHLTDASHAATGNKTAAQTAGIVAKYQEMARLLQNDAGAFIRKLPGWIVRQSHDSYKMAHASGTSRLDFLRRGGTDADFRAWHDFILPKLDERTFADTDDRTKFLRQAWLNLVSGNHSKAHGAGDWLGGFKGPGNLAKRASQERNLHFKSADDWFDYNQRFGQASLFEAIFGGLSSAAKNTALMRTWGTNPEAAFTADLDQLKRRARDRGDLKMHDKLGGWRVQAEFDALTGALNVPGEPTVAAISQSLRNLTSMAKLGGVVLSSLPDIAIRASALRHHGVGYLEGFGNGLQSVLRGRGKGAEREISDYIGVGIDGALGHMLAEFAATDGVPGRISKLMDVFFRANLLNWWTDSMKTGAGLILSRHLARNAGAAWEKLPEALQRSLGRHGIEAADWQKIRDGGVSSTEAGNFVTGELVTDKATRQKLRNWFIDSVNESMTIGGAREQAIRTFGVKSGTPVGEAIRFIMQFKSYPITFYTRHLKREFGRTGSVDGVGLAGLIVGATAMGYVAMSAKDLAKGRTPRDPTDPKTWMAAMQQGGGMGIYGDFLFGQYNRFGGGGIETLLGPTAGTVGDALRIFAGLREGEDQSAEATRFAINNAPFMNLFYARMAMDYLIFWHIQEAMSPGWARRFERRVKEDNAQTFLLKPTETVRSGSALAFSP